MFGYHRYGESDWTREVALLKELLFVALTTDVRTEHV